MCNINDITAETSGKTFSWWSRLKYNLNLKLVTMATRRNPTQERVVRFFTKTSERTQEHYFDCPCYYLDTLSASDGRNVFREFIKCCYKISRSLNEMFPTYGEYWYDIAVTLNKQDDSYNWTILKSNNPRCVFGNLRCHKNCEALVHTYSHIEISGHALNGKFKSFAGLISSINHRAIVLHNRRDMIALFKVFRFIGATQIMSGGRIFSNTPTTWKNLKFNYGCYLDMCNGQLTAVVLNRINLPTNPHYLMDIDEIIIKRSVKAQLSDLVY